VNHSSLLSIFRHTVNTPKIRGHMQYTSVSSQWLAWKDSPTELENPLYVQYSSAFTSILPLQRLLWFKYF